MNSENKNRNKVIVEEGPGPQMNTVALASTLSLSLWIFIQNTQQSPSNFWSEVQGLRDFKMINRVCVWFSTNEFVVIFFFRAVIGNKYRHRHARRGKNWDRRMSDLGWDQCGSGNCFTFCGFTDSLYTLGGIGVSKVSFIHDAST